jgi:hypothetical protein
MLAFEVSVNGHGMIVAGVEDWSILTTHVTALREKNGVRMRRDEIELHTGGMTLPETDGYSRHFRWDRYALQVGDIVSLKVVNTDTAAPQ